MGEGKCPDCGSRVYVKYASKKACQLAEALTMGVVNAKDLYYSLSEGPVLTDSHRNGALHECVRREVSGG